MSTPATIEQYQLSAAENDRRIELEGIIRAGLETFYAVGNALAEIREQKLYRSTHDTFEDYCRAAWSMSKTHANRLIQAAEVVASLPADLPAPATESQARELASIADVDERGRVWATVNNGSGKPTAAAIKAAIRPTNYEQIRGQIYALGWNLAEDGSGYRVHNITVPHNWVPFKTWDEVENWLVQAEERRKQQERAARVLADDHNLTDVAIAALARAGYVRFVSRSDDVWKFAREDGFEHTLTRSTLNQIVKDNPPPTTTPATIAPDLRDRLAALGGKLDRSEVVGGVTVHHYHTKQGRFVVEHANFPGVLDMLERAEGKGKTKAPAIELPKAPEGWGWESDMQGAYPRHRLHQLGGTSTTNYYQSPSDAIDEAFEIAGTVQLFRADEVETTPAPKGASAANDYYRDPKLAELAHERFRSLVGEFLIEGSPIAQILWEACLTEDQKHRTVHLGDVLWSWAWPQPVVAHLANQARERILKALGLVEE